MELEFTVRHDFGRDRYYPSNTAARALVALTGRKCLKDVELQRLVHAGFEVITCDPAGYATKEQL